MTGDDIQVEDGNYTRIHNAILEAITLADFSKREYKCLLYLLRMTYGWRKKSDAISYQQFADATGLARRHVIDTLNGLVAKCVITKQDMGDAKPAIWSFNKYVEEWQLVTKTVTSDCDELVTKTVTRLVTKTVTSTSDQNSHPPKKGKTIKERERESAHAHAKIVHYKSPHLDARRFVDGFIPAGTGVNPVEVYYERFNIREDAARLNALQEDDLVRECPDLDKLRTVVVAYSRTSYRKGNLQLILDWYANGTPANGKPSRGELAAFNGQLSDRDAALATRRALDASAKRTLEKFGATPTRGTRHADH